MEKKREKLERKLKDAREKLAKSEVNQKELLKAQQKYEHYKKRVEKLTKLLSGL